MIKVTMTKTQETKGTHVYSADTDESDVLIPVLYIKKEAFKGNGAPEFITVTIAEGQS